MTRDDDTRGYYLAPIAFFLIGLSQLFSTEMRMVGVVTILGAIVIAIVGYRATRRTKERDSE